MAINSRCKTCRCALGPEDNDGHNTQPDICAACRAKPAPTPPNPWAIAGRQQKALAMAAVIDDLFLRKFKDQGLDPFDQAFRIFDASYTWTDDNWETIGERALKPNGEHYPRKPISDETRAAVRGIYQGRARAPLASRSAS